MKEMGKKVRLSKPFDINKISIEKDEYFPKAYIIDLPLESTPNHVWQDIFEQEWKSSRHLWDRKLFVVGDKLRLVATAREFKEKLDWVEQVVEQTNRAIDEYNRTVKIEKELKEPTLWEEKARIEMIKEMLMKKFGPG